MRAVRAFAGMAASRTLSPAAAPANAVTSKSPAQKRSALQSPLAWCPSAKQGRAINTLLSCDDFEILAWLTAIRSIFAGDAGGRRLSAHQLDALICLADTSEEKIKNWLTLSRRCGGNVPSENLSRGSTLAESCNSRNSSIDEPFASPALASQGGTPAESLNANQKDSFREPEIQALEKGILTLNKPVPPPPLEHKDLEPKGRCRLVSTKKDGHPHWSTSPENHRHYKTCDGFRRQENEQEKHYVFMPDGPIESFPDGQRCALCHFQNPTEDHLRKHNISQFAKSSKGSLKKSRKGEFEKLLNAHNVPKEHIVRLVEKWHIVQRKKAYACGLCVVLLPSLSKRTSHMCHEHFGQGQNLVDWDDSSLIKGLLLQPEVRKCCRTLFESDPSRADSPFFWPSAVVKDLRKRLELGQDAPEQLALMAFNTAETLEKPSSNQDVAATGSQFPPQTLQIAKPSAMSFPVTVQEAQPETSGIHLPTSAFGFLDVQKKSASGEDMFGYAGDPPYASILDTQPTTDAHAKLRIPTNSPAFNNNAHTTLARQGAEALFQAPITLTDYIRNHSQGGATTVEEHGMYTPPLFSTSSFIDPHPDTTCEFDPTSSPFPEEWCAPDQSTGPHFDANNIDNPLQAPVPKRKLSEDSVVAAHGRPQTMSPMGIGPGNQSAPRTILGFPEYSGFPPSTRPAS